MHSIISAAIGHTWYLPFEIDFILWLQSGVGTGFGDFLTKVMNVISMFGEEYILVAILGLLFWGLDKHIGENVGFTILTANIFNPLIKNIFCRTRPFDVVGSGVENLRDVDGYSFPSGHSTAAGALYPSLAINYKEKKWKWLVAIAIAVPLLVAFSRMYLGAHFLSDVVVGLALGVGTIFLLQLMHKLISNKYVVYLIVLIVSSVGMFYCTTTDYYTSYGMILGFVCAIAFEQKVCKFENTKVWWRVILRVIIGAAIFLGLNELIKLPFDKNWLNDDTNKINLLFRTLRYAIVTFVVMGIYPLLFKVFDKVWLKFGWIKMSDIPSHRFEEDVKEAEDVEKQIELEEIEEIDKLSK